MSLYYIFKVHKCDFYSTKLYTHINIATTKLRRFGTVDKFIKAYKELGLRHLDYNGESQLGVAAVQVTQRYGLRVSAEKAYLREAKNRRNLKILTHSQVVKIHISNCKPSKAIGIRYVRDGKYYNAYVNKEVILSAGAMISPQLLLLSGIGPKGQLEKFGIEVIKDLPVGQLFYDHIGFLGKCPETVSKINRSSNCV